VSSLAGTILADTNSLKYAFLAGGTALLDAYKAAAAARDLTFAVTDQVVEEIGRGPQAAELADWINSRSVRIVTTDTAEAVRTGMLARDNAGEKSMLEVAEKGIANGERTGIWSDDGHSHLRQRRFAA
jgi:hypothetical protein